jgi:hypothetical protein
MTDPKLTGDNRLRPLTKKSVSHKGNLGKLSFARPSYNAQGGNNCHLDLTMRADNETIELQTKRTSY